MASSPRGQREEESPLSLRTLTIASVASAAAAAVTSQLWLQGTWIAAAVTPVIVSLVSEAVRRPTERITRAVASERKARRERAAPAPPATATPQRPPGDSPPGRPAAPKGKPDRAGAAAPVRVYRQPGRRPPRRRIALGVVAVTSAIAFVIGVVALTATELVAGESIGKGGGRTTLGIGGGSDNDRSEPDQQQRPEPDQQERQPTDTEQRPEDGERRSTDEAEPPPTETTPAPTAPEQPTEEAPPPTEEAPSEPQAETAPMP